MLASKEYDWLAFPTKLGNGELTAVSNNTKKDV